MTSSICQTFQELAADTWRRIEIAYATGLSWSEESNTEYLLLTLRTRHPYETTIAAFSKRAEAQIGADWEWWFVGPSGAYGMRVQAKRIKFPSEIFSHLLYHPKGRPHDQMTTLIQNAIKDGLTPAYCLYVASLQRPLNSTWPSVITPQPQPMSGCLVGHAQLIQKVRSNDFGSLAPYLFPWHFLVCPRGSARQVDFSETSAAAMTGGVNGSITIAPRVFDESFLGDDNPESYRSVFLAEKHSRPPPYIERLFSSKLSQDGSVKNVLAEAGASKRGIHGIVVFRNSGDVR